jgi:His-Xaa-Ser system protein HxsD
MEADLTFKSGQIVLKVDTRLFRAEAVQKTVYRLAHRFTAVFGGLDGTVLPVTLAFSAAIDEVTALESARLFWRELVDQELREKIGEDTRSIRTLIIAQAFSRTGLIKQD